MNGVDPRDVWLDVLSWLRIAGSDRRVARLCLDTTPPLCDMAAYHCQQAAEKLLKACLVYVGVHVRRTHDLAALTGLVRVHMPTLEPLLAPMPGWTSWGIAYRYPAEEAPEPEPSMDALDQALTQLEEFERALRAVEPDKSPD